MIDSRHSRLPVLIFGAALSLLPAGESSAAEAGRDAMVAMGDYTGPTVTFLAIDDYSLPLSKDLCLYLSRPAVRADPVLTPSRNNPHATDTVSTYCYGSVLHDGGKFRMWYYGAYWKPNPAHTGVRASIHEGPVCYAESADGIHWTKPMLGQVEYNGGSDNNAIALPANETEGVFVIRDENDPDPARRYKMVYENTTGNRPTVDKATSPDGIHWTGAGTAEDLLEPSSFYLFNGVFYINAQNLAAIGEGGHLAGRQGFAWISPDFDHWQPEAGEAFLLPEPADPNDRGHDRAYIQAHLGVGATSYGNVLVGLYCQWHEQPRPGDRFGIGTTYGDFGLVVSNDGQHFREPAKGRVFLSRRDSRAVLEPDIRAEEILTQSGNSILNVGNQSWIYHGRWVNAERPEDWYSEIALATLPRDRWGALGLFPRASDGTVWTAPLTLSRLGGEVSLNAEGAAGMRVEIADANFHLIPELSGENAGATSAAGGLNCAVIWPKASLDSLVGRQVRLRIQLKKGNYAEPRLFALYVSRAGGPSAK